MSERRRIGEMQKKRGSEIRPRLYNYYVTVHYSVACQIRVTWKNPTVYRSAGWKKVSARISEPHGGHHARRGDTFPRSSTRGKLKCHQVPCIIVHDKKHLLIPRRGNFGHKCADESVPSLFRDARGRPLGGSAFIPAVISETTSFPSRSHVRSISRKV